MGLGLMAEICSIFIKLGINEEQRSYLEMSVIHGVWFFRYLKRYAGYNTLISKVGFFLWACYPSRNTDTA